MQRSDFMEILLDNTSPQVLSTVREYFLWRSIMHVYLVVNKLCDGFLCCLGYSLCNRPPRCVINRSNNPRISIHCLWQASYQIYSPALERLNKWVRDQLTVLPFLIYSLSLLDLTVRTCSKKLPNVFLHCRPPCSRLKYIDETSI